MFCFTFTSLYALVVLKNISCLYHERREFRLILFSVRGPSNSTEKELRSRWGDKKGVYETLLLSTHLSLHPSSAVLNLQVRKPEFFWPQFSAVSIRRSYWILLVVFLRNHVPVVRNAVLFAPLASLVLREATPHRDEGRRSLHFFCHRCLSQQIFPCTAVVYLEMQPQSAVIVWAHFTGKSMRY